MSPNEQAQITYLNCLVTGFMMLGQLDQLETTNAYRHDIKVNVKRLLPMIAQYIDSDLDTLWSKDHKGLYDIMDGFQAFIKNMATMRSEHIAGLGDLLEQFRRNPEQVLRHNEIAIIGEAQPVEEAKAA